MGDGSSAQPTSTDPPDQGTHPRSGDGPAEPTPRGRLAFGLQPERIQPIGGCTPLRSGPAATTLRGRSAFDYSLVLDRSKATMEDYP